MKNTIQTLKKAAAKFGGEVELEPYAETTTIQIVAPDGKQWANGNCVNMAGTFYKNWPETKQEAIDDLSNRIADGLEELDEELNP